MSNEFTPRLGATRAQSLKIGVLGFENAGKTLSALKLARGIVGASGTLVAIDTHNGQVEEYVGHEDVGSFYVVDVRPPFRPQRMLDAVKAAVDFGADAIVIDSMSHEWDGDGGVLDWAGEIEAEQERRNKKGNIWTKPKMEHKRFINHVMGISQHVLFCLRLKNSTDSKGSTSVKVSGDDSLLYDLTLHVELDRETHRVQSARVNDRYAELIGEGDLLNTSHGAALAKEAGRGVADPLRDGVAMLEDAARQGVIALRGACEAIKNGDNRRFAKLKAIPGLMDRLGELASEADAVTTTRGNPNAAPDRLAIETEPEAMPDLLQPPPSPLVQAGERAAKRGHDALAEFWDSLEEAEREELAERHDAVWAEIARQADANAVEAELSTPTQNETDERSAA